MHSQPGRTGGEGRIGLPGSRLGGPKLHQANALSRRRFLFLGAAAGLAVAVAPAIELFAPAQVPPVQTIDGILKDVYEDYVSDMVNRPCFGRIVLTGEQIAASRDQAGAFQSALTENLRAIARAVQADEERRLLRC